MQIDEESFRALARSSPWRWSSLHLTRRGGDVETVEAWVRRPGHLVVLDRRGGRHEVHEPQRRPGEPVWRLDGLVAHRPEVADPECADPMWQDYRWVSMLDPLELSHHTVVADLRAGEHRGRPAWRAVVAPTEGYEPRCACCPLLPCRGADRVEAEALGLADWQPPPESSYPIGFEVALDVATGVLVELVPLGGTRPGHTLDVEIHAAG